MLFGLENNNYLLIRNVFCRFPCIDEVIIFGSRALGTQKPGSDIDLALKGKNIKSDDILDVRNLLEELPLAYLYDLVNYSTIKTPALTEHINKHGISFYKKGAIPAHF